ncbi:MAG TPA: hypothetical protein VF529_21890 [Solirubrobacteraceae bacterium]
MHPAETREEVRRLVTAGLNDCEIARRLELPRTTVRDIRRGGRDRDRPTCPRCWRPSRPIRFTSGEYAELLGFYLGDGYIVRAGRTQRLRLSLDAAYPAVVDRAVDLVRACLPANGVSVVGADGGATAVVSSYSSHLACLLPQHGAGKKHLRPIELEAWQRALVDAAPWSLLRGLTHSDGCFYINRTGRYRYLSVDFHNLSRDILDLFAAACDAVGVRFRRYEKNVRIYDRASVREFAAFVGSKR